MDALLDHLGLSELRRLKPRQLLSQVLNFALILSTAFMIWKGLGISSNSPSPIVVVLSGRFVAYIATVCSDSKDKTAWNQPFSVATCCSYGTGIWG